MLEPFRWYNEATRLTNKNFILGNHIPLIHRLQVTKLNIQAFAKLRSVQNRNLMDILRPNKWDLTAIVHHYTYNLVAIGPLSEGNTNMKIWTDKIWLSKSEFTWFSASANLNATLYCFNLYTIYELIMVTFILSVNNLNIKINQKAQFKRYVADILNCVTSLLI